MSDTPADPHPRRCLAGLDPEMEFACLGEGDPNVFPSGNPKFSYLWRNVIPNLAGLGRHVTLVPPPTLIRRRSAVPGCGKHGKVCGRSV